MFEILKNHLIFQKNQLFQHWIQYGNPIDLLEMVRIIWNCMLITTYVLCLMLTVQFTERVQRKNYKFSDIQGEKTHTW